MDTHGQINATYDDKYIELIPLSFERLVLELLC